MHSEKRRTLPSCRVMVVATTCFVLGVATFAYGGDGTDTSAVRYIKGRTVFSGESPKAKLSISRGFRFIGTQQVNLHGNADAEQYVFAKSDRSNIVEQFYLIQFEHYLPTNHFTYDYASMRTTQIGTLQFNYDVRSQTNFGALLMEEKGSDGQAMERLLAKRHLVLPDNIVVVRMFHLPSADHRTELMIVYGEELPKKTARWVAVACPSPLLVGEENNLHGNCFYGNYGRQRAGRAQWAPCAEVMMTAKIRRRADGLVRYRAALPEQLSRIRLEA